MDLSPSTSINQALEVLETGPGHPGYDDAWELLALCNDPDVQRAMRQAMEETFGPYPQPTGYLDSGEPHWCLSVMAKYLGIPEEELEQTVEEIQEKWGDVAGVVDTSELHKLH
jgi:hypothetical protein